MLHYNNENVRTTFSTIVYLSLLLLTTLFGAGCVELDKAVKHYQQTNGSGKLDTKTVAAGLKEALKVGTKRTVKATSRVDGYLGNALIRIAMPEEFHSMNSALRRLGLGSYVEEMEVAMNRAAEMAAGEAREVFWQAIGDMTLKDAYGILKGHDSAATDYFRSRTTKTLQRRYLPIVRNKMNKVGLYNAYNRAVEQYTAIPFVKKPELNLDEYVTDRALSGLFTVLAKEEKKIRKNPAAQTTELLKRVFSEQ